MKSNAKTIMLINFLVYFAFRSFLLVIYLLPFRFVALLSSFLGRAYYLVDRSRHRFVNANISVVFGRKLDNKKREILGRQSCEHLAMYIFDLLKLNKTITPENYRKCIEITGSSHLMKSIERGKGTIAVMGHFGNFYLFRYLSYLTIPPMTAVIRKLDNPYLERLLSSILNKLGVIIERPDGAISNLQHLLRKNAIAVTLADHNAGFNRMVSPIVKAHNVITIPPDGALTKMRRLLLQKAITVTLADHKAGFNPRVGRHGTVVDFFGIPSQTHITAPLLARRTGASIVPLFVIRKGPGRYRIEINEPLNLVRTSNEASDLKKNTRKINQIFEDYIMKYPQHWFWLHRRWKDIPGLEDLYNTADPLSLLENFRQAQSSPQEKYLTG